MVNESIQNNFYTLDTRIWAAIRIQDKEDILKCLKEFQKIEREPKPEHLKILGIAKNLPEEIFDEILKFKTKFGKARKLARKPAH